jgi:hypothetical protein
MAGKEECSVKTLPGVTTIALNQKTMMQVVQYYLEGVVFRGSGEEGPYVTSVHERDGVFEIVLHDEQQT